MELHGEFLLIREGGECRIELDGKPIGFRLDLANHSPDGPEWGYAGSGPAQTSLMLLASTLDQVALHLYQYFKRDFIQGLGPLDRVPDQRSDQAFSITEQQILDWVVAQLVV